MLSAKTVISGVAWSAAESWLRQVTMFLVLVVLARQLGPEEFGLAALAMAVPLILTVPVAQGLPEALIQRPEIEPVHLDSVFWTLALGGLALTGLVWVSAEGFSVVFGNGKIGPLVRWTCVVIAIQALGAVHIAVVRRRLEFRLLAIRTTVATLASGVVGIGMALAGYGVWSLIGLHLARAVVETSILLSFAPWRPRLRYSYSHVRELLAFAIPVAAQSWWCLLNDELPKLFLGAHLGAPAAGVYALARRPLDLLSQSFVAPFAGVALPAVSRIQDDPKKIDHFFDSAVRFSSLVGFPVFIGFAAIAPDAVPAIFGAQWSSAVAATQLLMVLGLLRSVDSFCGLTLLALGHSRLVLLFHVLFTAIAIVVLALVVHRGVEAVAAGIVFCNLALVPIFLACVRRIAGIDVLRPFKLLPRLAAASAFMLAAVIGWRSAALELTPTATIIGGVIVGGLAYATGAVVLMRADLLSTRNIVMALRSGSAPPR